MLLSAFVPIPIAARSAIRTSTPPPSTRTLGSTTGSQGEITEILCSWSTPTAPYRVRLDRRIDPETRCNSGPWAISRKRWRGVCRRVRPDIPSKILALTGAAIETFSSDRADQSFRKTVLPRRARRHGNGLPGMPGSHDGIHRAKAKL